VRLGVHIPISGGFVKAAEYAVEAGCETVQLFSRNPRAWKPKSILCEEADYFYRKCKERFISPVVVHTPYLPNLASADEDFWLRSIEVIKEELIRAEMLGADYLVTHIGKSKEKRGDALKRVADGINEALSSVDNSVTILLENTAGQGAEIGTHFDEIATILEMVAEKSKVGVCFDTAHGFQAGYDIRDEEAVEKLVEIIRCTVGIERVKCVHLNDSKTAFGSRVDRHWYVGEGEIGREGFLAFMNHSAFANLPAIMETPKMSVEDDKRNIRKVFELLGRVSRNV